jgi:hypothetical protein
VLCNRLVSRNGFSSPLVESNPVLVKRTDSQCEAPNNYFQNRAADML